ncbi:MAG: 3-oxoacyl-ACP synthase [Alphaproteobacteria bacterium]|nr:3-oxoacyl-ACP synthase [Alphaproteobacteria bacterium]HCO99889.1 3-oxoacyl-ACP synthase [Rhodospirillaceae bacterium]
MNISDIQFVLGGRGEGLDTLSADNASWLVDDIFEKTGIRDRHLTGKNETAFTMARAATEELLKNIDRDTIGGLIFVTQSPDSQIPATACVLQAACSLPKTALAFDLNQGCSGFVYGLSVASSLIANGNLENCLLVCAETYGKYIAPDDRACRPIFSDAASAVLIGSGETGSIGPFVFSTDGNGAQNLMLAPNALIENGTARTRETNPTLHMNGAKVLHFTMGQVPKFTRALLEKASLSIDDIDLFIFHQASNLVLDNLTRLLDLADKKVVRHLESYGNTVSSTIPIALELERRAGHIRPGMTLLLMGFGVGYSLAGGIVRT